MSYISKNLRIIKQHILCHFHYFIHQYDSFILSALDISMLIDLVTLIMLFAYTLMYHLVRIKCIVTYDLYGLISHKGKTITSDVLRT